MVDKVDWLPAPISLDLIEVHARRLNETRNEDDRHAWSANALKDFRRAIVKHPDCRLLSIHEIQNVTLRAHVDCLQRAIILNLERLAELAGRQG